MVGVLDFRSDSPGSCAGKDIVFPTGKYKKPVRKLLPELFYEIDVGQFNTKKNRLHVECQFFFIEAFLVQQVIKFLKHMFRTL